MYRQFFQWELDRLEALSIATFAVGCARRGRAKRPPGTRIRSAGPRKRNGDAGGGWWVARLHHSPTRGGMPTLLGAGGLHPPDRSRDLHYCTDAGRSSERAILRHFSRGAVAFHGRERRFANLGSTRGSELPGGLFGSRTTPWRGSYRSATVRAEVLFTKFDRGFFIGISEHEMASSLGRDERGTGLDHGYDEFSPIGARDHGARDVGLSSLPLSISVRFRGLSAGRRTAFKTANKMRLFWGQESRLVPSSSIHFYLYGACEVWPACRVTWRGDVEPRISRISRMREQSMTRYPDRDSTGCTAAVNAMVTVAASRRVCPRGIRIGGSVQVRLGEKRQSRESQHVTNEPKTAQVAGTA